ncbi:MULTISPECIES: acetate--CoA ligase [Nocardia]|uniref:acetate--CoA ligase n=1 Tax=Nocardia nova TaxID=37330 RepID=A0A2S6AD79_9NOCA|nr:MULTISPECIES: acetate--CoA ligase [Nocardia]OBF87602.1 acetate--CoA ligase [Mycobacterium sp. 852002-51759_SCH5129042]MBF6276838.1 acetate--CoA ligase [Nocardia nova]MBV7703799.1 acetate--CoA ligase [Nocardia nova]OBA55581.1 acetate--CoA ligase [Nocardia sp. 852002-51101_SCH5132738]OBB40080.1 acetate--CoA ligase [Nocardia sp. 852002-51244_SCH5132740]
MSRNDASPYDAETATPSRWAPIEKSAAEIAAATLPDYGRARRDFSWSAARSELAGLPGGGVNIAVEAVDRHLEAPIGPAPSLRWLPVTGGVTELDCADLVRLSNKFAHVLRDLGVYRGERVCLLLGRTPELYLACLGAWKAGCVVSPLFSAFGPEPVRQRLDLAEASTLVTTAAHYRRKVAPIRDTLPALRHVIVVDGETDLPGVVSLPAAMAAADSEFPIVRTQFEDPALLHFTSGTTGRPKGAVHVHGAVVAHRATARAALDLRGGDVFWCTADPGWVTGMSYGVIAPLCLGATVISDEAEFDPQRWYDILTAERVSVWYTAPTALRMLMRRGDELPPSTDLSCLRFVASVGEPLNPEVVVWGQRVLGHPVHDNWWQTETGAIMIANIAAAQVRPGSMGRPLPGVEATILRRGASGRAAITDGDVTAADTGEVGELALRAGWPSMFRGYLNDPARYADAFAGGWYLTGDLARRDGDGYFWFVGRADDVIKSAGHLVGPFEVESVLMSHPAVAEAGVIGTPDPVAGELVKAFVVVRKGFQPSDDLRDELTAFGRRALGAVAPKRIDFVDALPHTRSGKVMRRLLKAHELGLPEGDVSTLETVR